MVRETATKKEVAFGNFNPYSNAPRRSYRMARIKVNAKKRFKRLLDLSKLTLFGI